MKQIPGTLIFLMSAAMAAILPDPPPGDLSGIAHLNRSDAYSVAIQGADGKERPLFVYATSNYWEHKARRMQDAVSFTRFAFTNEKVTVTVRCTAPVTQAVLRPRSTGVALSVKGQTLSFTLDRPRQIALEVNDPKHPLLIFADVPDVPDEKAQHYFAPGTVTRIGDRYVVKEGERVYVGAGAVVEGTFQCTGDRNVFAGPGIVSSGHIPWAVWDKDKTLCQIGAEKWKGFRQYQFRDLILLNSPGWWCYGELLQSTVRNVKSIAWNGNSDGLHLGGDSLMEGCFFFVNDDCLIANSGDNNTWRGCTIWRSPWGHPIISLLKKDTHRNYLWEDIDIISTEGPGPLITLKNYKNWGIGGSKINFTVRNIRVEGPRMGPLIKIEASTCNVQNFVVEGVVTESRLESEGLIALPDSAPAPSVTFRRIQLGDRPLRSAEDGGMKTSGDQGGVTFE